MQQRLALAFLLTLGVLILEVVGGLLSGSLALLTDAGHVFTDVVALGLSWYGVKQTERPSNYRMTYGYHRVGIFIAFINAALLLGIAIAVLVEASRRFMEPRPVDGELMSVVALLGLAVNCVVLLALRGHRHNLNLRSAFLHVAGDALSSVAVIIGGVIILFTGWMWVDPAASVLITGVITFGAVRILKESVNVMLEATPINLDTAAVVRSIYGVPGIRDVHHIHIWSITPELLALSCHVSVDDVHVSEAASALSRVNEVLEQKFAIGHSTIQVECEGCDPNELYCTLSPEGEAEHAMHTH